MDCNSLLLNITLVFFKVTFFFTTYINISIFKIILKKTYY